MSPSDSFNRGQQEEFPEEEAPPVISVYNYPNSPLSGYVEAHTNREVTPVYFGLGPASCVASFAHTASKYPACCITLDAPGQLRTNETVAKKLRGPYNTWLFVDDVAEVEEDVFALPDEYDNPAENPTYRLKVVSVGAEAERKIRLRRKSSEGSYNDWKVIFSEKENIWVPFSQLWTPPAPQGTEKQKPEGTLVK